METKSSQKARIMSIFSDKYDAWANSQEGQTDAYSYEESYVKFIDEMGHEILEELVGNEKDVRKKNGKYALR